MGPQGLQGIPGEGAQGPAGPEGPQGPKGDPALLAFAIVTDLPNVQVTTSQLQNTWYALTNRVVSLNKVTDSSRLRITYQDTLGARTSTLNACQWRIVIDGTVVATFSDDDVEIPSFGWRIHNGAHMAWALSVPAGTRIIRVDGLRTANAAECLSGWNTTGNFLSVEEIP